MICFHFTIFVVLETTAVPPIPHPPPLWFAFILLSLSYWKQPKIAAKLWRSVVICFHFTIFVVLETTNHRVGWRIGSLWFAFILLSLSYWKQHGGRSAAEPPRCDLLSFYYLCRTGNNLYESISTIQPVVICFHFTIFVVLETTQEWQDWRVETLWFAFILLSLSYWKQRHCKYSNEVVCCDLLSFYYLCRTGNNPLHTFFQNGFVVICFHFTIFVVLETT